MAFVLLLIRQNLLMLCYLAVGYFLYRKKLITVQGSADLGRMLLYVVMPMAIIKSYFSINYSRKAGGAGSVCFNGCAIIGVGYFTEQTFTACGM